MNFYEFGQENSEIIVMLHGLSMTWDMLQDAVDILKADYHVIVAAIPGHDPKSKEEFTSVENAAGMIEEYLLEKEYDDILCIYGLSMGGAITIRILADNRVRFQKAVIDAGITPYEMPRIFTRAILVNDFATMMLARRFSSLLKYAFAPERFDEEIMQKEIAGIKNMTPKTIWNAFDSANNYSMPADFPEISTCIEYWYGEDEKKDRKLDLRYVKRHIPNVKFRMIPNMTHGQYVCSEPEKFSRTLKKVLKGKSSAAH
ncbi:MAG: alpha/beta hydrolase [Eubacteriales bacterium]|nr:alpha/beta hydrolase [Eubacteriales bacterium]